MWHSYKLGKSMRRHRRASRLPAAAALIALALILLVVLAVFYDLRANNSSDPIDSKAQSLPVAGSLQTFYSTYFRFQDTGKWVLNQPESTDTKYIYYKYRGLQIENQLIVYVNQVPIPLYLAVARVLPVRIVNGNSFDATTISSPCISAYAPHELHKEKNVTINGATMLCNPDSPLYTVVLGEINGSYILKMHRLSGSPIQFVITLRDYNLPPKPEVIKQIVNSFQAL
jgi:hypothetical protein